MNSPPDNTDTVRRILDRITSKLNESAGLPSFLSLRMNKRTYFERIKEALFIKLNALSLDELLPISANLDRNVLMFRDRLGVLVESYNKFGGEIGNKDVLTTLFNILRYNSENAPPPTISGSNSSVSRAEPTAVLPEWSSSDNDLYRATEGKEPNASGGFGKVYKVKNKDGIDVAVKVITITPTTDIEHEKESVRKEAQTLFELRNVDPPIFPKFIAYETFRVKSHAVCVIITEWIEGIELYDFYWLKNYKNSPETDKDRIAFEKSYAKDPTRFDKFKDLKIEDVLQEVRNKIEQLHNAGYVHRDIKPENIMLTMKTGKLQVYLIDPGFTVPVDTILGNLKGTPGYTPYFPDKGDLETLKFDTTKFPRRRATRAANAYAFNKILQTFEASIEGRMPYTGGKRIRRKTTRHVRRPRRSMRRSTRRSMRRSMQRSTRRSMQRKAQ